MTKAEITGCLSDLGALLDAAGVYAIVDVFGGSAMSLAYFDLRTTYDVDAVVHSCSDFPAFQRLLRAVASKRGLPGDWFNEAVASLVSDDFSNQDVVPYGKYGGLEIRVPTAEFLLAMKLFAARAETSDVDDAVLLARNAGARSRSQLEAVLRKYVKPESVRARNRKPGNHNAVWRFLDEVARRLADPL